MVKKKKKQASMSLQNQRTDGFIMLHHTVRSWIIIRAQLKLLWGTDGQFKIGGKKGCEALQTHGKLSSSSSAISLANSRSCCSRSLLSCQHMQTICQQAVSAELLCTVTVCPSHLSWLQILVVRLGWESHGLHRNGWILLTALKWTVVDLRCFRVALNSEWHPHYFCLHISVARFMKLKYIKWIINI